MKCLTSNDTRAHIDRCERSLRVGQRAYFGRSKTTLFKYFYQLYYMMPRLMNKSLKNDLNPLRITFQSRDKGFFFMAPCSL